MSGANPDYYAETASIAGAPSAQQQQHPQGGYSAQPPSPPYPQQQQQQHQPYYPPPPGPPPSGQPHEYHPQPLQSHPPYYEAPSGDAAPPPPSYASQPDASAAYPEEKPPPMPPRPVSGQNPGQVPYYPPPPGQGNVGGGPQMHGGAGPAAGAGAAASGPLPPLSGDGGHVTDEKKKKTMGERFYEWSVKASGPVNKLTNKLGSEAFWPTSMDKECDKAARILKSFTKDGFYTKNSQHPPPSPGDAANPGPAQSSKALVKIPAEAIRTAKGLAIFTTFRTALHISGAGGSGVVVARLPDGSWSPPSGFLIHTLGAGFTIGLDIYDCVCVLRTDEAVRAFTRPRLSLGGEIGLVAGPVGAGTAVEAAVGKSAKPVWSYMKSRGLFAGVQADGTVVVQRPDANAAFYGDSSKTLTVDKILRGEVPGGSYPPNNNNNHQTTYSGGGGVNPDGVVMWPQGARQLIEVLKSAEGQKADERVIEQLGKGPTPGDLVIDPQQLEEVKK
ncbi:hypothetical protein BX600DRAFT_516241 [Xylariales sp. PMI_506]|nr:hypothetical protein BX600DRAFT_516241 [Xylariales sp. PMI_506]